LEKVWLIDSKDLDAVKDRKVGRLRKVRKSSIVILDLASDSDYDVLLADYKNYLLIQTWRLTCITI